METDSPAPQPLLLPAAPETRELVNKPISEENVRELALILARQENFNGKDTANLALALSASTQYAKDIATSQLANNLNLSLLYGYLHGFVHPALHHHQMWLGYLQAQQMQNEDTCLAQQDTLN